jgi:hypothetical protein
MWGRLEREIRLLPQVVAVSLTAKDIVVLAEPGADAAAVREHVRLVADIEGDRRTVRVIGGDPARRPLGPLARRSILAGSIAALSFAVVAGVLNGASLPPNAPPAAAPPEPARNAPITHVIRSAIPPADTHTELTPTSHELAAGSAGLTPIAIGAIVHERPSARPTFPAASPSASPSSDGSACPGPPDRDAPRERPGAGEGNGPPSWSRSILVAPHDTCAHGRDD